MTSPAAILFDLDGTLIDSEPIWGHATRVLAATRNTEISEEILRRISGLDSTLAMEFLHAQLAWQGRDIPSDVAFVQEQVRAAYLAGLHWLPGARSLLAETRRHGLRTGLVTSTYRPLVDIVVEAVGGDAFDVVVCGDDGWEPKPSPQGYLQAAAFLGVDPADCVAIEDSQRGVASARAAGCVVLHASRIVSSDEADGHVDDLTEVTVARLIELFEESRASARMSFGTLRQ